MDLLSRLPAPRTFPPNDIQSAPGRSRDVRETRDNQDTRDDRVEETGALSFSGILARNQENKELKPTGGRNPAQTQEPRPEIQGRAKEGANQSPPGPSDGKLQMGQAAGQATLGNGSLPGQIITAPGQGLLPVAGDSPAEIKPTGGDGRAAGTLDLSQLQTGEQVKSEQVVQAPVKAEMAQNAADSDRPAGPQATVPNRGSAVIPEMQGEAAGPKAAATPLMAAKAEAAAAPLAQVPVKPADLSPEKSESQPGTQAMAADLADATVTESTSAEQGQAEEGKTSQEHQGSTGQPGSTAPGTPDAQISEPQLVASADHHGKKAVEVAPEADQTVTEAVSQAGRSRVNTSVNTPVNPASARTDALAQGRQIRHQVIQELSSRLDGRIGNEKITLQLNPEKLGQVEIQFLARGNDLSIAISASSSDAEQAIREGVKELAEGIADKSGRWQQVDIKVDQRGQEQDKNDSRQENRRDQSRRDGRQNQQQQRQRTQSGGPDWASLRGEE